MKLIRDFSAFVLVAPAGALRLFPKPSFYSLVEYKLPWENYPWLFKWSWNGTCFLQ